MTNWKSKPRTPLEKELADLRIDEKRATSEFYEKMSTRGATKAEKGQFIVKFKQLSQRIKALQMRIQDANTGTNT